MSLRDLSVPARAWGMNDEFTVIPNLGEGVVKTPATMVSPGNREPAFASHDAGDVGDDVAHFNLLTRNPRDVWWQNASVSKYCFSN